MNYRHRKMEQTDDYLSIGHTHFEMLDNIMASVSFGFVFYCSAWLWGNTVKQY